MSVWKITLPAFCMHSLSFWPWLTGLWDHTFRLKLPGSWQAWLVIQLFPVLRTPFLPDPYRCCNLIQKYPPKPDKPLACDLLECMRSCLPPLHGTLWEERSYSSHLYIFSRVADHTRLNSKQTSNRTGLEDVDKVLFCFFFFYFQDLLDLF